MEKTIYQEEGYKDRKDYLDYLARTHNVNIYVVTRASEILGRLEDFDELPIVIADMSSMPDCPRYRR